MGVEAEREFDVLQAFDNLAAEDPTAVAHAWRDIDLTRAELAERSTALAHALATRLPGDRGPIAVLGHKHPWMLVCFLACVRSGHAYVPIDTSLPPDRVRAILEAAGARVLLAPEGVDAPGDGAEGISLDILQGRDIDAVGRSTKPLDPELAVRVDEPFYVIFTSGSTGTPKGVQISRSAVNRFTDWIVDVERAARPRSLVGQGTIINQAPFSFDLSVMDLMIALATGTRLHSIDKEHIARPRDLLAELQRTGATSWVSTPSFADLCLGFPEFDSQLLPELRTFLFCGETLPHATAAALRQRFPGAGVVNTYGPTESTVAVTDVLVTDEVLAAYPVLPVGRPKPGTQIHIVSSDGSRVSAGEKGEIVIAGDTVSLGYHGRPDLTERAFGWVEGDGGPLWAYRTGDAGVVDTDGHLHFHGRLDFQVKLHGYRIEIEDIEANLRALPGVLHAVVMPRYSSDGTTVTSLHGVVQPAAMPEGSSLRATVALKNALKAHLPDYMIPKTIAFVPAIPLTPNGKADRAAVAAMQA
jgi:D-alanine--poly(phosphoribitol) ligase subunit 1